MGTYTDSYTDSYQTTLRDYQCSLFHVQTSMLLTARQAYGQTVETREEINSSLDELPGSFANIDFSLRSYVEDRNIEKASVDLVLAILKSVEKSIKFYTSTQGNSNTY
jgi:hypothetical protein